MPVNRLVQPFEASKPTLNFEDRVAERMDAVVIGISTGGPHALKLLIPQFPADFPVPMAVVLHMPVGYTELFAHQLDQISFLKVKEAEEGDHFEAGTVLIAPAGRHLILQKSSTGLVTAHLDARPFDTLHRPSADVLFDSAASVFGKRTLGVIMTGMGSDGLEGSRAIKEKGGRIITESEETCVVYGMPRSVAEAGLSDEQAPLNKIMKTIINAI